ncbi:hypothetical protein [Streptococcus pneumoniae]|uniref:hypothetical protein n=1 Tax=Streptococcus pneumoniae TaxID=1313 RepID=UPI0011567E35|nr:hypothetical protein [Streptococcus pneumoniae]
MKIKEHKRKLAVGCLKQCFEVVDRTDRIRLTKSAQNTVLRWQIELTWFEEMIFEEYNLFDRGWV